MFYVRATSVSADGTSATFPFPKLSSGKSLPPNFYTYTVSNLSPAGNRQPLDMGFLAVGSQDTSHQTPFGIDVANVAGTPTLALTLLAPGQFCFNGSCLAVGSQPVAVKMYGGNQPTHAIVANYGSDTVSIVNIATASATPSGIAATIPVGHQPTAILLKPDQTKAYVANSSAATVSEINLSNNTQSRTVQVWGSPTALTMDPSGTALWVGGLNYLAKVDLTNFGVVSTFPVTGQVTSLAISAGLNQFVYTTISSDLTTFQARHAAITTGTPIKSYAQAQIGSSSPYAHAIMVTYGGTTTTGPPGYLLSNSALVSASYGNSVAVVGTPTGFAVLDLVRQIDLLDATTPNPVRGIATDTQQAAAYLTVPDSNSVITVPLPAQHAYASATLTVWGSEGNNTFNVCPNGINYPACYVQIADSGTVSVSVNGRTVSTSYGQGDSAESVATKLAAAINAYTATFPDTVTTTTLRAYNYPVTATAYGDAVTLRAVRLGIKPNSFTLSTNCASYESQYYSGCSFWATPSGATLSGGN